MKILGINGSARNDGNTALLINTVFGELENAGIETELIQFSGNVIEPCKACWACDEQNRRIEAVKYCENIKFTVFCGNFCNVRNALFTRLFRGKITL